MYLLKQLYDSVSHKMTSVIVKYYRSIESREEEKLSLKLTSYVELYAPRQPLGAISMNKI
jgi:hypothetical protein